MKITINLSCDPAGLQMDDCQIEKEEAAQAVLAEHLHRISETGREDHITLLNAHVSEICDIPTGTEVVLADVDPEELVRFNEAYDAFIEAEEAMGQGMMRL